MIQNLYRMAKMCKYFALLTVLVVLTQAVPGFTQSALTVTPGNDDFGASSLYRLDFTLPDSLPPGGAISIVFPDGFDLSRVNLAGSSVIKGGLSTVVRAQEVLVIRRGEGQARPRGQKVDLLLSTVKNPGAAQVGAELHIRIFVHRDGSRILNQIRAKTYKSDTNKTSADGAFRLSPAE